MCIYIVLYNYKYCICIDSNQDIYKLFFLFINNIVRTLMCLLPWRKLLGTHCAIYIHIADVTPSRLSQIKEMKFLWGHVTLPATNMKNDPRVVCQLPLLFLNRNIFVKSGRQPVIVTSFFNSRSASVWATDTHLRSRRQNHCQERKCGFLE